MNVRATALVAADPFTFLALWIVLQVLIKRWELAYAIRLHHEDVYRNGKDNQNAEDQEATWPIRLSRCVISDVHR